MDKKSVISIGTSYEGRRVVVLGDVMVDEFLRGTVDRISPEAPVPVLEFASHTFVLGGAANVASNVVALGGGASILGAVGDDDAGSRLKEGLAGVGVDAAGILTVPGRRTTLKTRVLAHTQHVVRIDREERSPIPEAAQSELLERLETEIRGASALLISDYKKGTITPSLASAAIALAQGSAIPIVVDTKHYDVAAFSGATIMTPNVREAEELSRVKIVDDESLAKAARRLIEELRLQALLVTRAEEGMSIFNQDGTRSDIPALAIEVHDITGAGDTVAAALTLALVGCNPLSDSARFANLAAAVVVRKLGTATATLQEMTAFTDSCHP